jgi:hypothetical protein
VDEYEKHFLQSDKKIPVVVVMVVEEELEKILPFE